MKESNEMRAPLVPVRSEVKNLITMFEFYVSQRAKGKPIETLAESVRDMRLIIGRLLIDHFLGLSNEEGQKFTAALAEMLADCCEVLPDLKRQDEDYYNYCIEEILTPFEYAKEIKSEFADDPVLTKMLALDIPILRPFDYGLRGSFKVLRPRKKHRFHR